MYKLVKDQNDRHAEMMLYQLSEYGIGVSKSWCASCSILSTLERRDMVFWSNSKNTAYIFHDWSDVRCEKRQDELVREETFVFYGNS